MYYLAIVCPSVCRFPALGSKRCILGLSVVTIEHKQKTPCYRSRQAMGGMSFCRWSYGGRICLLSGGRLSSGLCRCSAGGRRRRPFDSLPSSLTGDATCPRRRRRVGVTSPSCPRHLASSHPRRRRRLRRIILGVPLILLRRFFYGPLGWHSRSLPSKRNINTFNALLPHKRA